MNIKKVSLFKGLDLKKLITISLSWIISSCIFVILVNTIVITENKLYLQKAINEASSPALWNVFSAIGCSLFGFCLILWKSKKNLVRIIINYTSEILLATFCIGLLIIGIALGEFIFGFGAFNISSWYHWFLGISLIILIPLFIIFNTLFWYLSNIIKIKDQNGNSLIKMLNNMKTIWRWIIGIILIFIFWAIIFFNSILIT